MCPLLLLLLQVPLVSRPLISRPEQLLHQLATMQRLQRLELVNVPLVPLGVEAAVEDSPAALLVMALQQMRQLRQLLLRAVHLHPDHVSPLCSAASPGLGPVPLLRAFLLAGNAWPIADSVCLSCLQTSLTFVIMCMALSILLPTLPGTHRVLINAPSLCTASGTCTGTNPKDAIYPSRHQVSWLRYQLRLPELRQLLLDHVSGADVPELLEAAGEAFPGLVEARVRAVGRRQNQAQEGAQAVPPEWMAGRSSPRE